MIRRGLDYENAKQVEESIRLIKFTGCTGTVIISSLDNNRQSVIYAFN